MHVKKINEDEFCKNLGAMMQFETVTQKIELGSVVIYCGDSPYYLNPVVLFQDAMSGTMLVVSTDEEAAPGEGMADDELADLIGSLAYEPTTPTPTVEDIKDIDDNIQRLRNDMTRLWDRVMALEAMRKAA